MATADRTPQDIAADLPDAEWDQLIDISYATDDKRYHIVTLRNRDMMIHLKALGLVEHRALTGYRLTELGALVARAFS